MASLPSEQRRQLENTVKAGRRTAEAAARVALERLTVGSAEPGAHLTVDERQLRNRLRAHGRQLGDQRDPKTGTQSLTRLLPECAYERWHRMLFARFLAENDLLIHDKEGMPVTLAECDELAADEGAPDGWTLATRFAARMLPQIFRPDDPVLQVGLAPEHKRALEKLVTELPVEVFTAEDSLGWVYQFWQAERKDEINASGDEITGESLPAVTQLFTEHYMVLFLLHNTIGAWWAMRLKSTGRISKSDWDKCQSEDDCRKLVALPSYEFAYLRFIKDGNGEWVPAAGGFPGWPKSIKDFKLLDPCCGSGHFLVAAFLLLALMRMQDERLSAEDACDAVLRENLHGLELDPRCTHIAAFALALTAWKFTKGSRPLPALNVACSGRGVNARKEDWLAIANGDERLCWGLARLYEQFHQAPELGSLINPRSAPGIGMVVTFAELQLSLDKALQSEQARKNDDFDEIGVAAQGIFQATRLLSLEYTLVATNVPYLGFKRQGDVLQSFAEQHTRDAKYDLATVFVIRCIELCRNHGTTALVTPHNWLFLGSYEGFRQRLLGSAKLNFVARLGAGAFETISGEIVKVALIGLTKREPNAEDAFFACDVLRLRSADEKAAGLKNTATQLAGQLDQLRNPSAVITSEVLDSTNLLERLAVCSSGMLTSDSNRFYRAFWEVPEPGPDWEFLQTTVTKTALFDGRSQIVFWQQNRGELNKLAESLKHLNHAVQNYQRGQEVRNRVGVAVSSMGNLPCSLYSGDFFDNNVGVICPNNPAHLAPIWAFCSSSEYAEAVRKIDQKLNVTNATLVKIPFDLSHWQRVAATRYPRGLPQADSDDPTQWLFHGRLADCVAPLQVCVARLLGYRWPRQTAQNVSGATPVPNDSLEKFVDEDGIVCIPSVRGEAPASERLRAVLAAAYGKAWRPGTLDELLSAVDYAGSNLEDWLRNGFFDQHSRLFHHRPFIWQIWDGRKDGFSALVNYHKLDHKLLEKLTYTYLGDWIKKQQEAVASEESGADDRLLKAQQLQGKLKLILEGEAPYDIFVRWKPLEQQPIGWQPDLNDGVRLNIRPFMQSDVLRKRPNIKWGKDRGKNPPGSPWGEERDNDRHLTLAEKREARKT